MGITRSRFRENGLFEFKDTLMTVKTAYPNVKGYIIQPADGFQLSARPQRSDSARFSQHVHCEFR
jgi:hypothetical protein